MEVPAKFGGEFDLNSMMMYDSLVSSVGGKYVAVTKVGGLHWGPGSRGYSNRVTTMDALQLQYRYCVARDANFKPKEHTTCSSASDVGIHPLVFIDRLCDGVKDCPDGEDEGGMVPCIEAQDRCSHFFILPTRDGVKVKIKKINSRLFRIFIFQF